MKERSRYIIGIIILLLVGAFCWYFSSIIIYLLVAAVVSILGKPLMNMLDRVRIRGRHIKGGLKAGITLAVMWILFILLFFSIIPLVINEFSAISRVDFGQVISRLEQPFNVMKDKLKDLNLLDENTDIKAYIISSLSSILKLDKIKDISASLVGFLSDFAIGAFAITFVSFFFLREPDLFSKILLSVIPNRYENGVKNTMNSVEPLLIRYFIGILIQTSCVTILNTLGLWIIGLEFSHAIAIGFVTGILNLIPYIGPLMGAGFGLLVGLILHINEPVGVLGLVMIYMAIVFSITAIFDNVLFQPLIYGNSVHAHPLEIFLVILIAGTLAGIPGMVLAIPGYTVVRVVLREFFAEHTIVKNLTKRL